MYTDPTGHDKFKEISFAIRRPYAALKIGVANPGKGKTDITNVSIRFSTNDLGFQENDAREGSQVNAFRHALWQTMITKELGRTIAVEAGFVHEEDGFAISGKTDFSNATFTTLSKADESIDLLNNKIGRYLGEKANSSRKEMSISVLDYYHNTGLWVVQQQSDGTYKIIQEKLSDEQYVTAKARLEQLDDDGFCEEDR
ncbi:DUF6973 domain-containing protein [Paenibacillus sp. HWE-109]|uniref:DUF6973 domain-containing protein n=1 Tax=Paenibacillus sp. HWE-109 TaxID=1306526 RepID=UPI003FCCE414